MHGWAFSILLAAFFRFGKSRGLQVGLFGRGIAYAHAPAAAPCGETKAEVCVVAKPSMSFFFSFCSRNHSDPCGLSFFFYSSLVLMYVYVYSVGRIFNLGSLVCLPFSLLTYLPRWLTSTAAWLSVRITERTRQRRGYELLLRIDFYLTRICELRLPTVFMVTATLSAENRPFKKNLARDLMAKFSRHMFVSCVVMKLI